MEHKVVTIPVVFHSNKGSNNTPINSKGTTHSNSNNHKPSLDNQYNPERCSHNKEECHPSPLLCQGNLTECRGSRVICSNNMAAISNR